MGDRPPVVTIVSADPLFRGALSAALSNSFTNRMVDAADSQDLTLELNGSDPALLILDAGDHVSSDTTRSASALVSVLVLGPDDSKSMIEAIESGALGYIPREAPFREIEQAALQVASGSAVVPPFMLGSLLRHVVKQRRAEASAREQLDTLTAREREVFELAATGLSHDDVGERLYISPATARTHLHRVFKKLNIHSKAELVGLAASCGLPTVEET